MKIHNNHAIIPLPMWVKELDVTKVWSMKDKAFIVVLRASTGECDNYKLKEIPLDDLKYGKPFFLTDMPFGMEYYGWLNICQTRYPKSAAFALIPIL